MRWREMDEVIAAADVLIVGSERVPNKNNCLLLEESGVAEMLSVTK